MSMPYAVFKGDPLYPEPTSATSGSFLAIHTKTLTLAPGCSYVYSVDVWSDYSYARDLKVQVGWIAPNTWPTASAANNPTTWLSQGGTPTVFRRTNGVDQGVTTISTVIPANTATSAVVLLKVTADTPSDVAAYTGTDTARVGVQTCDGGVNDIVVGNPVLTAICP